MKLIELNTKNLKLAIKIQNKIFPLEDASEALSYSLKGTFPHLSMQKYFLVKHKNKHIGITGLYAYESAPQDAWLGWFGVLEEERCKGFGTAILSSTMALAKDLGFKTFRLYTDELGNKEAVKLYKKFGMTKEVYNNPQDLHFEVSKTLIFSISLTDNKLKLWNNKNLYLHDHEEKNKH